ncbi:folate-binding protein [Kineococcus sp. T13]|uniref:CAF17-like 4Fe-4S cluster assembly/insertion protein YgfZ n=1 Tax=Kineococcus vitellinus TaxID=2696565 RepID=UPI001411BF0F|nr:folate-binding protein YgfZ [Kineococcus vitellinus]NAZ77981.1 folate-binding protein [Kineococcus vitellinus]
MLGAPGAVAADGPDAGVAWHYGDPVGEQRALVRGEAVVDASHRGVLRLTGPDRLSWLHSITTQALTGLPAGTSTETLVLSPTGRIEHDLHLLEDGEATWITVEPGAVDALRAFLERMRFMLRVEVADVSAEWAVLGEPSRSASSTLGPVWVDPWPGAVPANEGGSADTASYAAVATLEHPGAERPWREVLVPRAGLAAAVGGRRLAGTWAAEALRVEAWRPRPGLETDERSIPHELDWLRTAVHLHKGCYRGQETVAKVHNLGRPPRRLVMLHLDGSSHDLPAHGDDVVHEGRRVGRVTTAARHHELGPVALALVKRSLPVDAQLFAVAGSGTAGHEQRPLAAAQETIVAP